MGACTGRSRTGYLATKATNRSWRFGATLEFSERRTSLTLSIALAHRLYSRFSCIGDVLDAMCMLKEPLLLSESFRSASVIRWDIESQLCAMIFVLELDFRTSMIRRLNNYLLSTMARVL